MNSDDWDRTLRQANELRAKAIELNSEGLEILANEKMRELAELVDRVDKAAQAGRRLDRALRKNDPDAPQVRELDAATVARVVLRHWGDDAPAVLARALELAREKVASWTPTTTKTTTEERKV